VQKALRTSLFFERHLYPE